MAFDNNKLGELRPNQIITTFGPGSMRLRTRLRFWTSPIGNRRDKK